MISKMKEPACPLCGSEESGGSFERGQWTYAKCQRCSVVFLNPIPHSEELRDYYNRAYTVPIEAYARGTRRNAPPLLTRLTKARPPKGKLLEIGCSYGFFLSEARRDGWQVEGIELDRQAAAYARDKLGLRIHCGVMETALEFVSPPYDAIVAFHVIEHLTNPPEFLAICRKLLRSGGLLMLKTPNVGSWIAMKTGAYWQWLCPPAHIHLFSERALVHALETAGFDIEKIWTERGDAHNNLFELICAGARCAQSRRKVIRQGGNRESWSSSWYVNVANAASELVYWPVGLLVDPWLGKQGLQPELTAIAANHHTLTD